MAVPVQSTAQLDEFFEDRGHALRSESVMASSWYCRDAGRVGCKRISCEQRIWHNIVTWSLSGLSDGDESP